MTSDQFHHQSRSVFEIVFFTVTLITLLCGAFLVSAFFLQVGPSTEDQKNVLAVAIDVFKFGMAAILGLLGGRALP